jgi:hypothetical protein
MTRYKPFHFRPYRIGAYLYVCQMRRPTLCAKLTRGIIVTGVARFAYQA